MATAWRWKTGRSRSRRANEGAIEWRQQCRWRRVEGNDLEESAAWRQRDRGGKGFFYVVFFLIYLSDLEIYCFRADVTLST